MKDLKNLIYVGFLLLMNTILFAKTPSVGAKIVLVINIFAFVLAKVLDKEQK